MVKKAVVWLVAAFAVYSVVANPTQSAEVVRGAGEGLQTVGLSVVKFFDALTPDSA